MTSKFSEWLKSNRNHKICWHLINSLKENKKLCATLVYRSFVFKLFKVNVNVNLMKLMHKLNVVVYTPMSTDIESYTSERKKGKSVGRSLACAIFISKQLVYKCTLTRTINTQAAQCVVMTFKRFCVFIAWTSLKRTRTSFTSIVPNSETNSLTSFVVACSSMQSTYIYYSSRCHVPTHCSLTIMHFTCDI